MIAEGIIRVADTREPDPAKIQAGQEVALPTTERAQRVSGTDAPQSEIVRVALEQARKMALAANVEAPMRVEAVVIEQNIAAVQETQVKPASGVSAPGKRRPAKDAGRPAPEKAAPRKAKAAAKAPASRRRKADPEDAPAASGSQTVAVASAPTRKPRAKAVRIPS